MIRAAGDAVLFASPGKPQHVAAGPFLAEPEQVKHLDDEPSGDAPIDDQCLDLVWVAMYTRQQGGESVEPQGAHPRRQLEPERSHLAHQEEAIVAQSLIQRQEQASFLGDADLALVVARHQLAGADGGEVRVAGPMQKPS